VSGELVPVDPTEEELRRLAWQQHFLNQHAAMEARRNTVATGATVAAVGAGVAATGAAAAGVGAMGVGVAILLALIAIPVGIFLLFCLLLLFTL
jgi:hypothetical protein